jgi:hypothetical protein
LPFHKSWFEKIIEVDAMDVNCGAIYFMRGSDRGGYLIKLEGDYKHDLIRNIHIEKSKLPSYGAVSYSEFKRYGHKYKYGTKKKCSQCNKELHWAFFHYYYRSQKIEIVDPSYYNTYVSSSIRNQIIIICDDCSNHFRFCKYCHTVCITNENSKTYGPNGELNNYHVCPACINRHFRQCYSCKKFIYCDGIQEYKYHRYCSQCIQQFKFCNNCKTDKKPMFKILDKYYCELCFPWAKKHSPSVLSYNYKFKPTFFGTIDNLFFGCEFEIAIPTSIMPEVMADAITEKCNQTENGNFLQYFYAKHDGSIGHGVEIITQPQTYKFIVEHKYLYDELFEFKKHGCHASDTPSCGFHVHMDKTAFGNTQLYKFIKFVHTFKSFVHNISERPNLSSYSTYGLNQYMLPITQIAKVKNDPNGRKYNSVNLVHSTTVEVRVFQGTFEWTRFIKNIQFCLALYEYTNNESINKISTERFIEFLEKTKNRYRVLYKFIKDGFSFKGAL